MKHWPKIQTILTSTNASLFRRINPPIKAAHTAPDERTFYSNVVLIVFAIFPIHFTHSFGQLVQNAMLFAMLCSANDVGKFQEINTVKENKRLVQRQRGKTPLISRPNPDHWYWHIFIVMRMNYIRTGGSQTITIAHSNIAYIYVLYIKYNIKT